ncbi:unnamed protein product [Ceratitis capitata]|uniref:(Mediterranean fruit fly) hypothetical protein n=1 Tax=Ceratitis capitata TaxID=7213 RepID=A0A811U7Z9_CERCA|nr:unnamed protein product [Ceratitis capitata]
MASLPNACSTRRSPKALSRLAPRIVPTLVPASVDIVTDFGEAGSDKRKGIIRFRTTPVWCTRAESFFQAEDPERPHQLHSDNDAYDSYSQRLCDYSCPEVTNTRVRSRYYFLSNLNISIYSNNAPNRVKNNPWTVFCIDSVNLNIASNPVES